jgi:hypothetical protein
MSGSSSRPHHRIRRYCHSQGAETVARACGFSPEGLPLALVSETHADSASERRTHDEEGTRATVGGLLTIQEGDAQGSGSCLTSTSYELGPWSIGPCMAMSFFELSFLVKVARSWKSQLRLFQVGYPRSGVIISKEWEIRAACLLTTLRAGGQ